MTDEIDSEQTAEVEGVLVNEHRSGALIVGSDAAVADFVARWRTDQEPTARAVDLSAVDRLSLVSKAADLGAIGATTAQFVWTHKNVPRDGSAVLRLWVTDKAGQIVSNKAISPLHAVAVTQPALIFGMIALRAAVADSTKQITAAVERVEGKTDELLRLAGADRTGDVLGHHRLLRRRVERLDEGLALGETDWSTVATLGPVLEVGIERLRNHAQRLAGDLAPGLKADERAKRLDQVVREGRIGEVLQLLVVAEQSLYLWERLRVERIRVSEPDALDGAVTFAHDVLAEHLQADTELIDALRTALDDYGALKPSEFHRTFSGRKLRSALGTLRADLDYFVEARGLQIAGWSPLVAPTARDALKHFRTVAVDSGRSLKAVGGTVVDGGLAGISRAGGAIQAKAEQWRTEPTDDAGAPRHDTARDVDPD